MDGNLLHALILGLVEGITEFLPISSTGHLILAGSLLGFDDDRAGVFFVAIQTGAMLAVAFLPAAVLGLLFSKYIKSYLFHAVPVALAFILGGVIILVVERSSFKPRVENTRTMSWLDALKVGFAQCFALIPGTSRSGATIIGGMLFGLSRPAATEFSFFLAVPTLCAAGGYDLWKNRALFSAADLDMFAVGLAVSFASAFVVIRWLIHYVATHDFRPFAWYRILFGVLVLLTGHFGWVSWSA
jgi:undecaprenyl-diphosphatase